MSKRNYKIYDYNYQGVYNNHIKVNKRPEITCETLKYYNYHKLNKNIKNKDDLYYTIDKKIKMQKNKIPLSLNKKYIKKISQEKDKNAFKYSGRDNFKKTINTYSNENRTKEGNIIEELQNNKYLRPMLCGTNINNKLLKCKIEEPIKNIFTLKRFIPNNLELPFEACKSPIKNDYEISDESKNNYYNLNTRIRNDKYAYISPKNEDMLYRDNKSNNNSLFDDNKSYKQLNKYLIKYSENYTKKFIDSQPRSQKKKYFYSEERKEKEKDKGKIKRDNNEKFYFYKNSLALKLPNNNNNILKNKNDNLYIKNSEKKNTLEAKINNNKKRNKNLLLVYKSKLIEEFIIVLNKFFSNNLNKKKSLFFKNFKKHKAKSQSKNKIYFKKKNNNYIKKKLSNNENNKLILNFYKEKEKEKNKNKATTDSSANFNLNNKSFSNEIKSSTLSNNILSNLFINNNKLAFQNSSFLFTDQKHKNFSQSPEHPLKIPKSQIRTKTIIYKKNNSGSPNRSREAPLMDGFIYKKKNLNNENISINKINSIDLNNFYSNNINLNKKYSNNINHSKKGKIINIDINLGKPVNEINDQSPLDKLLLENNEPFIFKLNTISSKFMNKNKKKNKAKSGSKSKIKPPKRFKRFAEEENDDENFYNFNIDSYKPVLTYKNESENKLMNLKLDNDLNEFNKKQLNEYSKDENKKCKSENNNLFIRTNYYCFKGRKNIINNNFKNLIKEKRISLKFPKNKKTKNEIKNALKKIPKKKVNKLYINCTKFFINTLSRLIKRKIFMMTFKTEK